MSNSPKTITKSAKSIDEAIELALAELNVARENVKIEILETPSKGIFGLGGKLAKVRVTIAGDDFDEAIVRYMRKKHNLLIGERTAEDIKIKIGTTYPLVEDMVMEVRGRNLVTGLPKTVTVTSSETEEALRETTAQIVEAVIAVLERTPPELSADILDRGIVLTGGGALLRGLSQRLSNKINITFHVPEDPQHAVARGTGLALKNIDNYSFLMR